MDNAAAEVGRKAILFRNLLQGKKYFTSTIKVYDTQTSSPTETPAKKITLPINKIAQRSPISDKAASRN
jgi:hypothetical protein